MVKSEIVNAIRYFEKLLEEQGLNVQQIVVFGSQVEGNTSEESDIDLAVVSEDFKKMDIFERANLTKYAEIETIKKFMIPLDIITLAPNEFENSSYYLTKDMHFQIK
ncbi:MAG: nucleotidyltransferase domain-containing protein [Candidatus Heimdallarchaeota archaeon]|nr:nucleotidyltransferase domain-containing protein [Candidatus Heimdallarchaeota archaeon]